MPPDAEPGEGETEGNRGPSSSHKHKRDPLDEFLEDSFPVLPCSPSSHSLLNLLVPSIVSESLCLASHSLDPHSCVSSHPALTPVYLSPQVLPAALSYSFLPHFLILSPPSSASFRRLSTFSLVYLLSSQLGRRTTARQHSSTATHIIDPFTTSGPSTSEPEGQTTSSRPLAFALGKR
jgi:hypothetical protein